MLFVIYIYILDTYALVVVLPNVVNSQPNTQH